MSKPEFTHLHVHSHYSLLDGLSSPKDLAKYAHELGYTALALTDHGMCGGLLKFQNACNEFGIKPILGMEGYITDDRLMKDKDCKHYHVNLLAKNETGIKNLMYLSTCGYVEGFYRKPRMDFELLEKYKEGLIITTACPMGEIQAMLQHGNKRGALELAGKYKDAFGDDFYIEVMYHKYFDKKKEWQATEREVAKLMYKLSQKIGVKPIITNDCHYARPEMWQHHDVLLAMQTHSVTKDPDRFSFQSKDFYMKSQEEMAALCRNAPEMLYNTMEIAEKIESTELLKYHEDLLPNFDLPQEYNTEEEYLKELVKNGMSKFGLINKKEYRERIRYEMDVIIRCGYTRYFLILWDIINFANTHGIRVGAGRGSGVSSLCLYVLGITKLDPLKLDLIFERFLNPDRISPPDVDVDFADNRRDEVFDYIINKYGSDYCCKIGTYQALKARAVIREAAKALDIGDDWEVVQKAKKQGRKIDSPKNSLHLADYIAKLIGQDKPADIKLKDVMGGSDEDSIQFQASMARYPELYRAAEVIEGSLKSTGTHAAGIIVCREPIMDHIPIKVSKGTAGSQFEGPEVENLGLLKFDILGLKNLTILEKSVNMIKERTGKEIDIDNLEVNDKKVFSMFTGTHPTMNTRGIFQFESSGMVRLLENIRVDSFEDLIVAVALYRPGPLGNGWHDLYCDYKHGRKEIEYAHPSMEKPLSKTYGIMVFQENVMRVSQAMAGFTGGQADTLRKVMGKKDPELIKKANLDTMFIEGCMKNGIDRKVAIDVFDQMCKFAGYGFNRSHAAAYAFISYQCAYLKLHYPIEYMCNLLSSEINNADNDRKLNSFLDEANKNGIKVFGPHINRSGEEFKIDIVNDEEVLRFPLTALKGVGHKAVVEIVENQPYKNLDDFAKRTQGRLVNKKVFEALVNFRCFEDVCDEPATSLLKKYPIIKDRIKKEQAQKKKEEEKINAVEGSLFDIFLDKEINM